MGSSRRALIYFFLLWLLSSCVVLPSSAPVPGPVQLSPTQQPPPAAASPAPTFTPVLLSPTYTPQPSPTLSPSPSPTASPTACPHSFGQVQQNQIISLALNRELDFRIFLPPCYDSQHPEGYPVLYLLHGQGMDDSAWDQFGVGETAGLLMTTGELPAFIIVMPREEYYLQDMTASFFGKALLEDLIPWMDANYAACQARTCRAVGGLSRGALWAMLLGLENQLVFGSVGGHSLPGPVISPYYLKTLMDAVPEAERIRIYMDIGKLDRYRAGAEEFHDRLESLQIPHEWLLNEGTHNDAYWTENIEAYLRWYAAEW